MKTPNLFKRKKNEINFKHLQEMLEYYPKAESFIDEVTWADLNMDDMYAEMEETLTAQGDEALYHSLHNPVFDTEELERRSRQVQAFSDSDENRELLRNALKKTGRLRYDFRRSIQEDFSLSLKEKLMYLLGPATFLVLVILMLVTKAWNIGIFIFLCVIFNGTMHFKFTKKYEAQIDTLSYTYKLLNFCNLYSKKEFFKEYGLAPLYEDIRKTHKDISFIFQLESLDFIAEYLNILFLIKERRYLKVAKKLEPKMDILFRLYEKVGQMDMHQSMSIYLESVSAKTCKPVFVDKDNKHLQFEEMIHPLLANPVSNSLAVKQSIVITGSNMSGKSTFLRTIGLNVLFAQTWNFAFAKAFELCPMHIITSISLQDSIQEGKSYFLQEADAIKRMLLLSNRPYCTLFLIDEIFKGTNPVERIASATEICLALAAANTLGFVATHDLQLIPQIPSYLPYYFTENVTKEDLNFDYKIHPGITSTRNAVKILEYLKYEPALIDKINQRIALNQK
ncbi:MAG: hypothetical protein Q4A29_01955 [Eubacteriales bacterium]|nr:hypothetical protein [Eubacteriales bacterium]